MLSNDEISKIISEAYQDADIGETDIGTERDKALKYYRGDLYGDEKPGQSQVVTREVFECVEALVPQLVDVYMASDAPVVFTPQSADDVDNAEMESKFVNHVLMNENDGFGVISSWVYDAVLQKNGVVRCYWDEVVGQEQETYEAIPADQYTLIQAEAAENPDKLIIDEFADNGDGTVNVKLTRTKNNSKIVVEPVAPEDFRVARDHTSPDLSNATYCACTYRDNTYNLIAAGYEAALVNELTPDSADSDSSRAIRYQDKQLTSDGDETSADCRNVEVVEHYIRADLDQSGTLKLWRVVTGSGSSLAKVLGIEEADCIPYFSGVIMRNAHRYYGTSIPDVTMDIQRISSNLMRQALNNVYLSNSPTRLINTTLVENPGSLAGNVAGQAIGVKGDPNMAVRDLAVPFFAQNVFQFFETFKMTLEKRTGTSDAAQGLDPNALSDSTQMIGSMIMNAALMRMKYMARTFAETGLKPLMRHIHSLARKYEAADKMFMVDGQFVPINPRTWRERDALAVRVGLGYTEKRERIANLTSIIQQQKEIYMAAQGDGPLVNVKNVYDALQDLGKASGFPEVEKYFSNPEQYQAPEPKPDPMAEQMKVLQMQIMADMEQTKAKIIADVQKNAEKMAQDRYQFEQELRQKQEKMDDDYRVRMEQLELEYKKLNQTPPPAVVSAGVGGKEGADE